MATVTATARAHGATHASIRRRRIDNGHHFGVGDRIARRRGVVSYPTTTVVAVGARASLTNSDVGNGGDGAFVYTVQRGDTLPGIAHAFGVSLDELLQANGALMREGRGVNSWRRLSRTGQELVVPENERNANMLRAQIMLSDVPRSRDDEDVLLETETVFPTYASPPTVAVAAAADAVGGPGVRWMHIDEVGDMLQTKPSSNTVVFLTTSGCERCAEASPTFGKLAASLSSSVASSSSAAEATSKNSGARLARWFGKNVDDITVKTTVGEKVTCGELRCDGDEAVTFASRHLGTQNFPAVVVLPKTGGACFSFHRRHASCVVLCVMR